MMTCDLNLKWEIPLNVFASWALFTRAQGFFATRRLPPSMFVLFASWALFTRAQFTPDQVWASFGDAPLTSLRVSWATPGACATPALRFGTSPASLQPAPPSAVTADAPFFFENSGGLAHYYRAALAGLAPGTRYFYQVAACGPWSRTLSASTLPQGADFKVLVWGDMGRDGGEQILPALLEEAQAAAGGAPGAASFAVIAGDFGYDLHDEGGARGARFMSRLSNVSAFLPTLSVLGNHEIASGNATHYTNVIGKGLPGRTWGHWCGGNEPARPPARPPSPPSRARAAGTPLTRA